MRLIPTLLAALLFAAPVLAAPADPAEDIKRVETYLTALSTLTADFHQVDGNGDVSRGKFFLKRPGKMRWQYAPPTPILLVSDGKLITYYDADLDQVNYISIDDSLAAFLTQPVIQLESDSTKLVSFEAKDKVIRATIVRKSKPDEGSLTLEFSDNPLVIRQMVVKDAAGNATTVQLQNAKFDMVLNDKIFAFEDPRGIGRRHPR